MTIRDRLYNIISPSNSTEIIPSTSASSQSRLNIHRSSIIASLSSSSASVGDSIIAGAITDKHESKHMDYHIVLVDIKQTVKERKILCVKKIIDQPGLRYCAISYRWGETPEQAVLTPDYVAHVTSFALSDLETLCGQLLLATDEKVDYLWIDAICINQLDEKARKATIKQMSNIYKMAAVILAVPDMHIAYLRQNPSNKNTLARIRKHTPKIYHHVTGACRRLVHRPSHHHNLYDFAHIDTLIAPSASETSPTASSPGTPLTPLTPTTPELKKLQQEEEEENKKKKNRQQWQEQCECYQQTNSHGEYFAQALEFLRWMVEEWSNRTWVISEYLIGRSKNMKLWFMCFDIQWYYSAKPAFVPLFDCIYRDHFRHRTFLDMLLNSRAAKHEDRFYAVLPLSNYGDCIETQDTVSEWKVSDMTSVCLRLYSFVNLYEKAVILYCCSKGKMLILPSFASCYPDGAKMISKVFEVGRGRLLLQEITLMTPVIPSQHSKYGNLVIEGEEKEGAQSHASNSHSFHRLLHHQRHLHRSYRDCAFIKLKVQCYRLLSTSNKETKKFWHQHEKICQQLEFGQHQRQEDVGAPHSHVQRHQHHQHHKKYHLDQVFIPFVDSGDRWPIGVQLVGNLQLNRWLVYHLTIINVDVPASEWKLVEEMKEFHIY